jgi:predicted acyltransferase
MPAAPPPAPASPARVAAVDALRGIDMALLLIADPIVRALARVAPDRPVAKALQAQFTHPSWEGFTLYDLIFPLFEFLIGVSAWLSVTRRLARGEPRGRVLRHALLRAGGLVLIGMAVNGNLLTFDPSRFRLTYSVLQMLAVASLAATLAALYVPPRRHLPLFVALLVGYWALQTFVPLPAQPRTYVDWQGETVHAPAHRVGVYAPGALFSFWLDDRLFGDRDRWKVGWTLKVLTHAATALLGVMAGRALAAGRPPGATAARLAAAGVLALGLGWAWSVQFPIIKNLWSSSFVLWAGGWSLLLLAAVHGLIEGLGLARWAVPFLVVGANSLVAYLLATLFRPVPNAAADVLLGGLEPHAGSSYPLVFAAGSAAIAWLFLRHLHRARVFVRL